MCDSLQLNLQAHDIKIQVAGSGYGQFNLPKIRVEENTFNTYFYANIVHTISATTLQSFGTDESILQ